MQGYLVIRKEKFEAECKGSFGDAEGYAKDLLADGFEGTVMILKPTALVTKTSEVRTTFVNGKGGEEGEGQG